MILSNIFKRKPQPDLLAERAEKIRQMIHGGFGSALLTSAAGFSVSEKEETEPLQAEKLYTLFDKVIDELPSLYMGQRKTWRYDFFRDDLGMDGMYHSTLYFQLTFRRVNGDKQDLRDVTDTDNKPESKYAVETFAPHFPLSWINHCTTITEAIQLMLVALITDLNANVETPHSYKFSIARSIDNAVSYFHIFNVEVTFCNASKELRESDQKKFSEK